LAVVVFIIYFVDGVTLLTFICYDSVDLCTQ